jgi:hypothetical protein
VAGVVARREDRKDEREVSGSRIVDRGSPLIAIFRVPWWAMQSREINALFTMRGVRA